MGTSAAMAKKRTRPGRSEPERDDQVRLIVSSAFKRWLQGYADHRQLTMTDTIVQALIRDAKAEGFDPPPKR